ncbi:MAG: hypothetical protein ACI841_004978 [Planctomycetota bacterium]|jgi:hypothetical protein
MKRPSEGGLLAISAGRREMLFPAQAVLGKLSRQSRKGSAMSSERPRGTDCSPHVRA